MERVSKAPNQTCFFRLAPTLFNIFLLGSTIHEPLKNYFFAAVKRMSIIGSRMNTSDLTLTTFINNPLNAILVGFSGWI